MSSNGRLTPQKWLSSESFNVVTPAYQPRDSSETVLYQVIAEHFRPGLCFFLDPLALVPTDVKTVIRLELSLMLRRGRRHARSLVHLRALPQNQLIEIELLSLLEREYFETSRRTCIKVWPGEKAPDKNLFATFQALRHVIMTGWEMPGLLRAIIQGYPESRLLLDRAASRNTSAV